MRPIRLIIGGSSCVGKTTLAQKLCERYDLKHVETDCTLPNNPLLQPLNGSDEIWDRPAAELRDRLICAAETAVPYLSRQMSTLSASRVGWIVEGERVHPKLAVTAVENGEAQAVFIVETDGICLYNTLMERLPGFVNLSESRRRAVADVDRLYNEWIKAETVRLNLVCVESHPWQSLAERALAEVH